MTKQQDSINELRADLAKRELERSKTGATGFIIRLTLAIVFMYLIFISHAVMGVIGPAIISIFFLIALLTPVFYQMFKSMLGKRRARSEGDSMEGAGNVTDEESLQES